MQCLNSTLCRARRQKNRFDQRLSGEVNLLSVSAARKVAKLAKEKIIVALDVDSVESAEGLVRSLRDEVGAFKVGLELFNSAGTDIFRRLKDAGAERIFYDAKFHDIPNTVAGAVRAAIKNGIWMLNLHASGGAEMMKAAAKAAKESAAEANLDPPKLIGVTVLTSIDERALSVELGVTDPMNCQVVRLARLAQDCGLDGVVASPKETALLHLACGNEFLIVTPGVRPAAAAVDDQKRVMTPAEAVKVGADYIVVGRPITKAQDPAEAARAIAAEIT